MVLRSDESGSTAHCCCMCRAAIQRKAPRAHEPVESTLTHNLLFVSVKTLQTSVAEPLTNHLTLYGLCLCDRSSIHQYTIYMPIGVSGLSDTRHTFTTRLPIGIMRRRDENTKV